jgi:poly(3-hydroxybutyrate) depolymerase
MPFYHLYEMTHAALSPSRALADATRLYYRNPVNPFSHTEFGRSVAASAELFERLTRRYGKPEFGITETVVGAERIPVREEVVWSRPFARVLRFAKQFNDGRAPGPKLLLVAPMSGHYATLLRGTVQDMLPNHDVYITDWIDARMVSLNDGRFDLDDYIDYIISILHRLGPDTHIMAVCQPSVPVLAAVGVMEAAGNPYAPASMTLMGGPIDTRINPTAVNRLAEERDLEWFRRNAVMRVPFPHPGFMRDVYPGFLQLSGFMSMNLDRHITAHRDLFQHLIEGDGDSAEKHRDFYDEYNAVMDLTAEFYLQTVDNVFIRHALPKGEMAHRGELIDFKAIKNTALMTVEGEKDDISGVGQTKAAHDVCSSLTESKRAHYEQPGVGHYGVFNGSRFRSEIAPRISDFIATHDSSKRSSKPRALKVITGKKAMNQAAE